MSRQAEDRTERATGQPPLVISVFRLANSARRAFSETMADQTWAHEAGLKPGCFGVMRCVAASAEPLSQRDLSDKLGIDPSDIVGLVDVLEQAGFVTRKRDEADRRRYALALTDSGWAAVSRFDELAAGVSERLLANLTRQQQDDLEHLLNLVLADQPPRG